MKNAKRLRGFTLVELLIVITIIGILSGGLMLTMSAGTDRAEATRIVTDLNSLKLAAGVYYADNVGGEMTSGISNLKNYVSAPEKLDGEQTLYSFVIDEDSGEWYVGYDISSASSGVRESLQKMAESNGLLKSTSTDTSDVYDGGTAGVYVRVR